VLLGGLIVLLLLTRMKHMPGTAADTTRTCVTGPMHDVIYSQLNEIVAKYAVVCKKCNGTSVDVPTLLPRHINFNAISGSLARHLA
jgi:hypothetical protein